MTAAELDKEKVLGKRLTRMSRQELCEFISALCQRIMAEVGTRGRRGGIFPDNISLADNGDIGIGPAGESPWSGEELKFVAPELYWNGKVGAASDVYSVGLLLYYAISGGRLPYEGECADAQLRRMSGDDLHAPNNAGGRLGEIIEKTLRFKPENRYQTLDELRVVIDSCAKNLYLSGASSAEVIFKKNDDELSDVERMMVGIIEKEEPEVRPEPVEEEIKVYKPVQPKPKKEAKKKPVATVAAPVVAPAAEPVVLKKESASAPMDNQENKPEMAPVAPARRAVQYRSVEREKKIEEEVKKRRRRPLAVILVLCAVLVVVAIVLNAILKDFQQVKKQHVDNTIDAPIAQIEDDPYASDETVVQVASPNSLVNGNESPIVLNTPAPQPEAPAEGQPAETVETPAPTPVEHHYEIFVEDVSWIEARDRCVAKGGHLVVIGSPEEFNTVAAMAEEVGANKIWIGCHRIEGNLIWENDENPYYNWAQGEPTYVDTNDNVAEDYIMMWNNRGWAYNDNRNDPIADYPEWYSGTVAYVCEYGK